MGTENLIVYAYKIDDTHIYYRCPSCFTIQGGRCVKSCFKANGQFYRSAEPSVHRHGSAGNYENRVEHRGSHCPYDRRSVEIYITDDTEKPLLPTIMKKSQHPHNEGAFIVNFN